MFAGRCPPTTSLFFSNFIFFRIRASWLSRAWLWLVCVYYQGQACRLSRGRGPEPRWRPGAHRPQLAINSSATCSMCSDSPILGWVAQLADAGSVFAAGPEVGPRWPKATGSAQLLPAMYWQGGGAQSFRSLFVPSPNASGQAATRHHRRARCNSAQWGMCSQNFQAVVFLLLGGFDAPLHLPRTELRAKKGLDTFEAVCSENRTSNTIPLPSTPSKGGLAEPDHSPSVRLLELPRCGNRIQSCSRDSSACCRLSVSCALFARSRRHVFGQEKGDGHTHTHTYTHRQVVSHGARRLYSQVARVLANWVHDVCTLLYIRVGGRVD